MLAQFDEIENHALAALQSVKDENDLQQWRVTFLGRSSPLMRTFDNMGQLSKEERPAAGS
jgi:hypothetical protein